MWQVRRVHHPDAPGLGDLVGDADRFRRDIVYRHPLEHRATGRWPTSDDLWSDLLRRSPRQPAFRVVRAGETTSRRGLTRTVGIGSRQLGDVIDANAVVDRYRRGDTVVAQSLHQRDPHLARVATNLALALDHPVQVNAYLSPGGGHRGLDIHFDYHDVFVVQVGGSKHWRVWNRLPRTIDPVRGRHTIATPELDELGAPRLDVVLRPGDVLYLPRGYPHVAETTDEHSDHLTIGVTAITWHKVLQRAIEAKIALGRFTQALPVRLLDLTSRADLPDVGDLLDTLLPDVLRHWVAREVWRRMPQTRLRPLRPAGIDGDLRFAPGPLLWLTEVDGRAVLGLGDRLLDFPTQAAGLLGPLLASPDPVCPGDLGALDVDSRGTVLRRLVAEGVLVPSNQESGG